MDILSALRNAVVEQPHLVGAYAVTWGVILGYVISLARRRRQILREAEALTRAMDEG